MDCDQIIYLGLFAIIAIYLYQNVLRPEPFVVGVPFPSIGGPSVPAPAAPQRQVPQVNAQAQRAEAANIQQQLNNANETEVRASEPLGRNAQDAPVQFNRTPSSCYPEKNLSAGDLLPADESKEISEFNQNYPIGEGILKGINFLSSGYSIGVNTVGQSLKNANRQLRSEPPNPQVSVSPWMNSSIGPDLLRRPLEVDDSCGK